MFNATVHEAEILFDTEYYYFEHDTVEGHRIACDKYYLPQNVQRHVDFAVSHDIHKKNQIQIDQDDRCQLFN